MKRVEPKPTPPEPVPVEMVEITGEGVFVTSKVPTLFTRDWEGNRLVTETVTPGCEWVLAGEGIATEKIDGTACLIWGGQLYKRYDAKPGRTPPDGFIPSDVVDPVSGRTLGWVLVGDGPEDRYAREAWVYEHGPGCFVAGPEDGTYELVGPKVQGNPHRLATHRLLRHGAIQLEGVPRDYAGLKTYLTTAHIEGIVWHGDDGQLCKLKSRDLGINWP